MFLVVCLPVCYFAGILFMGGREAWLEACHYFIKPDFRSLLDGEFTEDLVATFKMMIWLFGSIAVMAYLHFGLLARFFE